MGFPREAQLTAAGVQQMYEYGQFMRQRYHAYFENGERSSSQRIRVISSATDRTISSAQALIAGLLPPNGTQRQWNTTLGLYWNPFPVYSRPSTHDGLLLNFKDDCPEFTKLRDSIDTLPIARQLQEEMKVRWTPSLLWQYLTLFSSSYFVAFTVIILCWLIDWLINIRQMQLEQIVVQYKSWCSTNRGAVQIVVQYKLWCSTNVRHFGFWLKGFHTGRRKGNRPERQVRLFRHVHRHRRRHPLPPNTSPALYQCSPIQELAPVDEHDASRWFQAYRGYEDAPDGRWQRRPHTDAISSGKFAARHIWPHVWGVTQPRHELLENGPVLRGIDEQSRQITQSLITKHRETEVTRYSSSFSALAWRKRGCGLGRSKFIQLHPGRKELWHPRIHGDYTWHQLL